MNLLDDLKKSLLPVDAELFCFCSGIYSAAAHLQMPTQNPASHPVVEFEGRAYALSDIPINRGMLAVVKELRDQGAEDETIMAMTCRLLHFGEIFGKEELAEWFQTSDEVGAVRVSEALIKACASARLILEDDRIRFDIADIARIARLYDEEERKETTRKS